MKATIGRITKALREAGREDTRAWMNTTRGGDLVARLLRGEEGSDLVPENIEQIIKDYHALRLGLPKSAEAMRAYGARLDTLSRDGVFGLYMAASESPKRRAQRWVTGELWARVEAYDGPRRWVRKDRVRRADGADKNVARGTKVEVFGRERAGGEQPKVKAGMVGEVIASGAAERWAAKKAVGTTAAVQVQFPPTRAASEQPARAQQEVGYVAVKPWEAKPEWATTAHHDHAGKKKDRQWIVAGMAPLRVAVIDSKRDSALAPRGRYKVGYIRTGTDDVFDAAMGFDNMKDVHSFLRELWALNHGPEVVDPDGLAATKPYGYVYIHQRSQQAGHYGDDFPKGTLRVIPASSKTDLNRIYDLYRQMHEGSTSMNGVRVSKPTLAAEVALTVADKRETKVPVVRVVYETAPEGQAGHLGPVPTPAVEKKKPESKPPKLPKGVKATWNHYGMWRLPAPLAPIFIAREKHRSAGAPRYTVHYPGASKRGTARRLGGANTLGAAWQIAVDADHGMLEMVARSNRQEAARKARADAAEGQAGHLGPVPTTAATSKQAAPAQVTIEEAEDQIGALLESYFGTKIDWSSPKEYGGFTSAFVSYSPSNNLTPLPLGKEAALLRTLQQQRDPTLRASREIEIQTGRRKHTKRKKKPGMGFYLSVRRYGSTQDGMFVTDAAGAVRRVREAVAAATSTPKPSPSKAHPDPIVQAAINYGTAARTDARADAKAEIDAVLATLRSYVRPKPSTRPTAKAHLSLPSRWSDPLGSVVFRALWQNKAPRGVKGDTKPIDWKAVASRSGFRGMPHVESVREIRAAQRAWRHDLSRFTFDRRRGYVLVQFYGEEPRKAPKDKRPEHIDCTNASGAEVAAWLRSVLPRVGGDGYVNTRNGEVVSVRWCIGRLGVKLVQDWDAGGMTAGDRKRFATLFPDAPLGASVHVAAKAVLAQWDAWAKYKADPTPANRVWGRRAMATAAAAAARAQSGEWLRGAHKLQHLVSSPADLTKAKLTEILSRMSREDREDTMAYLRRLRGAGKLTKHQLAEANAIDQEQRRLDMKRQAKAALDAKFDPKVGWDERAAANEEVQRIGKRLVPGLRSTDAHEVVSEFVHGDLTDEKIADYYREGRAARDKAPRRIRRLLW